MSSAQKIKILLIEDNKGDARLIHELLKEIQYFGYTLEWRENLSAGIQAMQKTNLDLLLLDLTLPDSQGLETVLHVLSQTPDVPIVVLTGHDDATLAIKAVAVGAQDYLVKGEVDAKILGRAIHYAIERNKLVMKLKENEKSLARYNVELEQRVGERTLALKDAQEKMMQQEKLAAIGKLAGTVGHELRNPLGVISNSIYYLTLKLPAVDEKIKKHLKIIQEESAAANKIISDLLDFARSKPDESCMVDIPGLLKETLERVQKPKNIKITTSFEKELPGTRLDPRKMQQAFQNIIVNAFQAMPDGGGLEISAKLDKDMITIAFKDTGVGISKENLQKLFEPLFSTKVKGIGLGLVITKEIVENYKGKVEVESVAGAGSTFTIILPITTS
jgi:signal transduction histidine kinase